MFEFFRRHKVWRAVATAVLALLLIAAALPIGVVVLLNPQITRYVESEAFRAELEKETAKGLHFPSGRYEPIKRTGTWTGESAGFAANNGWKALKSMDARGITVKFNPWGVFLRRWQLDEVRIQSGEVGIQVYQPKPEPAPAKPWFHIFLPERVYLKRVESEPVDVTWQFRGKKGGFFGTRLLITPHGRDFNYQATGGIMKGALMPDLRLRETRMLITKTWLTLYNLDLQPKTGDTGRIRMAGKAGTREDKSVDCKIDIDKMPIDDWLPSDWSEHVAGAATGTVHWKGKNPKLETSEIDAALRVDDGRVSKLPFLVKLATLTNEKELERLALNDCSLNLVWNYPNAEIKNLAIEEKGKFRAEGTIKIRNKSLGGEIELGVARRLLDWLPKPEEVFSRERDGYLWTTVHLSGTIDTPEQDLSPRIVEALKESPTAALAILFRQFGVWLRDALGGN
jgi:hypothetical protein